MNIDGSDLLKILLEITAANIALENGNISRAQDGLTGLEQYIKQIINN